MRIIIDQGHGGSANGATRTLNGYKVKEKDLNLIIGNIIYANLKFQTMYEVNLRRSVDVTLGLPERVKYLHKDDIFVSIHHNACTSTIVSGFETWAYTDSHESNKLASFISNEFDERIDNMKNRGVKRTKDFYVLEKSICPAVLVECGYMSNKKELAKITSPAQQINIASCIVEGIKRYVEGINYTT